MAATDLDLPILPNADQIRRRMFATVRKGFDPDQVREYLGQVANQVESLEAKLRETKQEAESLRRGEASAKEDLYDKLASRVSALIRTAEEQAEEIRRSARDEADRMVGEARREAAGAKGEAERILGEARAKADEALSGLAAQRESLGSELKEMRERLLGLARDLEGASARAQGGPHQAAGTDDPAAEGERVITVEEASSSPEDLWTPAERPDLSMPDIPPLDLGLDDDFERDD